MDLNVILQSIYRLYNKTIRLLCYYTFYMTYTVYHLDITECSNNIMLPSFHNAVFWFNL